MTHSLHPAAENGFSSAAELYQQVRPNYPQAIVTWLKDELNIHPDAVAIDLGSGTGKFLHYLKQVTSNIIAVEPIPAMLEQLKIVHPEVKTLQASSHQIAQSTHSVDAILCAQSFHWFAERQTLQEMHRLLKPQGHLGLVWNQRDISVDWVKALADYIAPFESDTPRFHSNQWQNVFQQQELFEFQSLSTFTQHQVGSVEQVVSKRLLSTSFIAAMSAADQAKMKTAFESIVFEHTGLMPHDEVSFPYITYAYHYRAR